MDGTEMRRLDTVPWARRSQARHLLKEIEACADQFRADLLHNELNADGAIEDVDRMISKLQIVKRLLKGSE